MGKRRTPPVQLSYTLAPADLVEGLVTLHRNIFHPWYRPLLGGLIAADVLTVIVVFALPHGAVTTNDAVADGGVLIVRVLAAAVIALLAWRVLSESRWVHRLLVRRVLRANPAVSEPAQTILSDAGIQTSVAGTGTTQWTWSNFPVHVETERSFVLLTARRWGATVLVLPKGGLATEDAEPLRRLLSAHSQPLI